MLHIVNKPHTDRTSLASCLRLSQDGDALLLIEDGIYAATQGGAAASGLVAAAGRLKVYVLQPDVEARGMAGKMIDGLSSVDYAGFVDLVAEHSTNQTWL